MNDNLIPELYPQLESNFDLVQNSIAELWTQINSAVEKLTQFREDNSLLTKSNEVLSFSLDNKLQEFDLFNKRHKSLIQRINQLNEFYSNEGLNFQNIDVQLDPELSYLSEFEEIETLHKSVLLRYNELKKQLLKIDELNEQLTVERKLKLKYDEREKEFFDNNTHLEQISQDLQYAHEELIRKNHKITELFSRIDSLKDTIAELSSKVYILDRIHEVYPDFINIDEFKVRNDKQIRGYEFDNINLKEKISALEIEELELYAKLEDIYEEKSTLELHIVNLNSEINLHKTKESESAAIIKEYSDLIENSRNSLSKQQSEIELLNKNIKLIASNEKDNLEDKKNINESFEIINNLQNEIHNKDLTIINLQMKVSEFDEYINSIKNENQKLKNSFTQLQENQKLIEIKEQIIHNREDNLNQSQNELVSSNEIILNLQKELKAKDDTISLIQLKVNEFENKNNFAKFPVDSENEKYKDELINKIEKYVSKLNSIIHNYD